MLLWFLPALAFSLPLQNPISTDRPPQNWGLEKIESDHLNASSVQYDAAVNAPVVVAIIDTGADLQHHDLRSHLWFNSGETGTDRHGLRKELNGIDDDQNGFIDDVNGWDFANGKATPRDTNSHGTHIAGIISSVAPRAKLMILKYFDADTQGDDGVAHTVHAIDYAVRMGARVINYSAGGRIPSAAERTAIERAARNGVLFVAAAGNEGRDSDLVKFYPADYPLDNILSVTATSPTNGVLPSSNFGAHSVALAAPGEAIWSTVPGGSYRAMTGTSQATAFASGVAALMIAQEAELTPCELISHLIFSGTQLGHLQGKTRAATLLNARRALSMRGASHDAFGMSTANAAALDPDLFAAEDFDQMPMKTTSFSRAPAISH